MSRITVVRKAMNHGPAFSQEPAQRGHQMVILPRPYGNAETYYDKKLSDDQNFLKHYFVKSVGITEERNGSLSFKDPSDFSGNEWKSSIRKYEDYFVGQMIASGTQYGNDGNVFMNCYFFKKVYSYQFH